MEVNAVYHSDSQVEVHARSHRVLCDQPLENGGTDQGMTPPEFLLASLSACAAYYAAQYLKTRGLQRDGLKVRVEAAKALKPARLGPFQIEVTVPGLDERHEEGLRRAVKACLIHNTLLAAPLIEITVDSGVLATMGFGTRSGN